MVVSDIIEFIKSKYGIYELIVDKLIITLIILIAGFIIGRLVGNFIRKILSELEINNIVKLSTKAEFPIDEWIGKTVTYVIYFLAITMALAHLGISSTVLMMIAGTVLVIFLIAFILGIKDYVPNLIAGIIIQKNKPFKVGDEIKVNDTKGKVSRIRLIETEINRGNDLIFIPNSTIMKGTFKVTKKK